MNDTNEPPTKSTSVPTRPFGPFLDVPSDRIKPAGWKCSECRNPVERLAQTVPGLAARMTFHACACGCAVTHEDESQPDRATWAFVVGLLQTGDAKVVIFDGAGSLAPGLSGVN